MENDEEKYQYLCKHFGKTLTSGQIALMCAHQDRCHYVGVQNLICEKVGTTKRGNIWINYNIPPSLVTHVLAKELNCPSILDKSIFEIYSTLLDIDADKFEHIWKKWKNR
jgi:hypothetical protein